MAERRDIVVMLAVCEAAQAARVPWWQVARAASRLGSAEALLTEPWEPVDRWENDVAIALAHEFRADAVGRWDAALSEWFGGEPTLRFITINDAEYPITLRSVFNPPPFLTLRGALTDADVRGVAVVGTRSPSPEGVRRARRLGYELAEAGVTVYSGLAKGIDAAAHTGALEAAGRTIAVIGHGFLQPYYPKENRPLAAEILSSGAIVSQFRPDTPPTQGTFPMRNIVMSGLAQGTVVVEAGRTSGARMQARAAVEQGRRVWFLRSLVQEFEWAREFEDRYSGGIRVVDEVSAVVEELKDSEALRQSAARGVPEVSPAEEARRPVREVEPEDDLVLFQ